MKLLVTGGHLTPALATIDFLLNKEPDWQIIFVGREFTQEKNKQESREKIEITKRGLSFTPFRSPRFTFITWWEVVLKTPVLLKAIIHALWLLIKIRPNQVLSFGGYLAVPISFAAWVLRIPIITHEQTRTSGLANRMIAHWATKVAVSHPSSIRYFPQNKVVLTGNPLRSSIWQKKPTKPNWITQPKNDKPLLYITGGNQGSEIINLVISQAIPQISKKWLVIHQCGLPTATAHYKNELERTKAKLPTSQQKNYIIREWITESELAWIYDQVQCVVSRAGANTTDELEKLRIPAILIPLPFAHAGEQVLNAQALVKQKLATMIEQKDFNSDTLQKALIKYQTKSRRSFKKPTAEEMTEPARKVYDLISKIYS